MKAQAYGIDISNFAGALSNQQVRDVQGAGQSFCVVEYTYGDVFEQQVRALVQQGIRVAGYFFVYWSRITEEIARLHAMLDLMASMTDVQFGWQRPDGTFAPAVWIDCEQDPALPNGLGQLQTTQWIASFVDECGGRNVSCGIYTGEYWWKAQTGNDGRFAGLPLWHASQYQQTVPVPFANYYAGHEYGGWPVPMFWQHRGDVVVGGVSCDQDIEEWEAA